MTDNAPAPGSCWWPSLDDEDPGAASWQQWCWARARRRALTVPREVAPKRPRRAKQPGLRYREYTLGIMERGRYLQKLRVILHDPV